jgi:hypothetical protein
LSSCSAVAGQLWDGDVGVSSLMPSPTSMRRIRIVLADWVWPVYRMIGKLWGVAFVIARP